MSNFVFVPSGMTFYDYEASVRPSIDLVYVILNRLKEIDNKKIERKLNKKYRTKAF